MSFAAAVQYLTSQRSRSDYGGLLAPLLRVKATYLGSHNRFETIEGDRVKKVTRTVQAPYYYSLCESTLD